MSTFTTTHDDPFSLSSWLYATRPKTFTASLIPVLTGTALAYHELGAIIWTIPICALLCSIFIQIGTHFANDAIDFDRGTDTKERIGPMRPTIQGLLKGVLTPRQVMGMGIASLAIGALFGLPLMAWGGIPVLIILVASVFFGYGYTGGPYPLSYIGIGDLFVVLFYGWISVGVCYCLQTQKISPSVVLLSTQIGILTTIMMTINNLRDWMSDKKAGRRTFPVRFGITAARWETTLAIFMPSALGLLWIPLNQPWAAYLPLATLPLGILLCRNIWRNDPAPIYNEFFAQSAMLHLLFGAFLSAGLLFG